jgi:hypothetical protein
MRQAQADAWRTTNEQWVNEVKTEFAGEKLTAAQATVSKALNEYGGQGVREAFDLTGAGNNPAIFRLIHNMAKALGEGTPATNGTPAGQGEKTLAERMYPNLKG